MLQQSNLKSVKVQVVIAGDEVELQELSFHPGAKVLDSPPASMVSWSPQPTLCNSSDEFRGTKAIEEELGGDRMVGKK